MIPPVVVDIAPADAPVEHRRALLEACNEAAEPAPCRQATGGAQDASDIVAIVSWDAESGVRIELGRRQEGRVEWRERRLQFSSDDPVVERWRAVGLAVGTLATFERGDATDEASESLGTRTAAAASSAPTDNPELDAGTSDDDESTPAPSSWGLDASYALGTGFEGHLRQGGALGLHRRWATLPLETGVQFEGALGSVDTRLPTGRTATLAAQWISVEVRTGGMWTLGTRELGFACGGFVERIEVSSDVGSGRANRFVGGARATLLLRERLTDSLSLLVTVDGGWRTSSTLIALDDARVARVPPWSSTLRLGLSFGL